MPARGVASRLRSAVTAPRALLRIGVNLAKRTRVVLRSIVWTVVFALASLIASVGLSGLLSEHCQQPAAAGELPLESDSPDDGDDGRSESPGERPDSSGDAEDDSPEELEALTASHDDDSGATRRAPLQRRSSRALQYLQPTDSPPPRA